MARPGAVDRQGSQATSAAQLEHIGSRHQGTARDGRALLSQVDSIVEGLLTGRESASLPHVDDNDLPRGAFESLRFAAVGLAIRSSRLLERPPIRTLELQLQALVDFARVTSASLWMRAPDARLECLVIVGSDSATRGMRRAALDALEGNVQRTAGVRAQLYATRVPSQFGEAALVVRAPAATRPWVLSYADDTARAVVPILEHQLLLDRLQSQQILLAAADQRLAQIRYDLHDGALQHLGLVIADLGNLKRQLALLSERLVESKQMATVADRELRELLVSFPIASTRRGLDASIRRELRLFRQRTNIEPDLLIEGHPAKTTPWQRNVAVSVVREALTNVRDHSFAKNVAVTISYGERMLTVKVVDDGAGFSLSTAETAERAGHLGLVGMRERVRLVDGVFRIESRPGGPTVVTAVIPHAEPARARNGLTRDAAAS